MLITDLGTVYDLRIPAALGQVLQTSCHTPFGVSCACLCTQKAIQAAAQQNTVGRKALPETDALLVALASPLLRRSNFLIPRSGRAFAPALCARRAANSQSVRCILAHECSRPHFSEACSSHSGRHASQASSIWDLAEHLRHQELRLKRPKNKEKGVWRAEPARQELSQFIGVPKKFIGATMLPILGSLAGCYSIYSLQHRGHRVSKAENHALLMGVPSIS